MGDGSHPVALPFPTEPVRTTGRGGPRNRRSTGSWTHWGVKEVSLHLGGQTMLWLHFDKLYVAHTPTSAAPRVRSPSVPEPGTPKGVGGKTRNLMVLVPDLVRLTGTHSTGSLGTPVLLHLTESRGSWGSDLSVLGVETPIRGWSLVTGVVSLREKFWTESRPGSHGWVRTRWVGVSVFGYPVTRDSPNWSLGARQGTPRTCPIPPRRSEDWVSVDKVRGPLFPHRSDEELLRPSTG